MTVPAGEPSSLLDWATGLVTDPTLRSRFAAEPRAVLEEQGLAEVPPADLHHSLPLVTDSVAARVGVEIDATGLTTVAHLAGETAVDALARHLGSAVDVVVASEIDTLEIDTTPPPTDPAEDPADDIDDIDADLDDIDPDHFAPQETTTMTTSASAAAAHGFDEASWARIETRAEKFGYGDDVDRFISIANQSDDRFTALFGDGVGDGYWRSHPGPGTGSAPPAHADDVLGGQDTDLDGFDPSAPDADPVVDVRTPGTPQGQHALELEALSHGYPTAEAYVSDAELTGGLRDNGLAWEPQNGSAAYGQLQNYMDAAASQGLTVNDYAAQHYYTQDEIDAAYADPQAGGQVGDGLARTDTDLDGFGEPAAAGGDTYVPHGDDPFSDMLQATGQGNGLPGGDVDLDGFGASAGTAGGDGYVPHGDDPFMDMVNAGGSSAATATGGDVDLDGFGSGAGDASGPSVGASDGGGESFGGGGSDDGSSTDSGSSDDLDSSDSSGGADSVDDGGPAADSGSEHMGFSDHADAGSSDDGGSDDAGSDDAGSAGDGGGESFG